MNETPDFEIVAGERRLNGWSGGAAEGPVLLFQPGERSPRRAGEDMMARSLRRAALDGIDGWLEDDLAFVRPWDFDLGSIPVPVTAWQGRLNRMVPFSHGEWLVSAILTATPRPRRSGPHILDDPAAGRSSGRLGSHRLIASVSSGRLGRCPWDHCT